MCKCQTQERRIYLRAKCSDLCYIETGANEHYGYVPMDLGIGGEDYVEFAYCLNCGQIKGNFPLPPAQIEKRKED